MAANRGTLPSRSIAGLPQGDHRPGRGTGTSQCPKGHSTVHLHRHGRASDTGGRGNTRRADSSQLPLLPGADLRRSLYPNSAVGALQARHTGRRQSEHGDDDSCRALVDRASARSGAPGRGAQASQLHRQPPGCLPAGGSLQRFRTGLPAALCRVSGLPGAPTGNSPRRAVAPCLRCDESAFRRLRGGPGRARSGPAKYPGRLAAGPGVLSLP